MEEIQAEIQRRSLPSLIQREFVKLTDAKQGEQTIRVMQWNLLAQSLTAAAENFIHCPLEALQWDNRKLRIIEEILRFRPTVLCLEEVDMYEYLVEQLAKFGYMGVFFPKPDSPCLYVENSFGADGCAIFYDASKVTLAKSNSIILKFRGGTMSNQVSVMCQFQTKSENPKDFLVAGTHLKAKSGFSESRHEQSEYLANYILEHYKDLPIIICGDFNGDSSEPLYSVMKSSELGLSSAYTAISPSGEEPKYTTWKIRPKGEACHTIDYVWYTQKGLKLTSLLDVASDEEIGEKRLPSLRYPSDHISLLCEFVVE